MAERVSALVPRIAGHLIMNKQVLWCNAYKTLALCVVICDCGPGADPADLIPCRYGAAEGDSGGLRGGPALAHPRSAVCLARFSVFVTVGGTRRLVNHRRSDGGFVNHRVNHLRISYYSRTAGYRA